MMGMSVPDIDMPVVKTSNALLAFKTYDERKTSRTASDADAVSESVPWSLCLRISTGLTESEISTS